MEPAEARSCAEGRYEEALGALRRRIVDPAELTRVVTNMLQPSDAADLEHHRTMLRLSRDLTNRPIIVTTNFDTLIERALAETDSDATAKMSFAGQTLPLPGTADFEGIIHLHGRVSDPRMGLTQTPLVMTSADYGDAYMRSGWASRFLFDLVRCKTVVLVGYSAGDAPVRYFLNVLESDRERFRELKPVYALDGIAKGEVDADGEARWRALAVHPILYSTASYPALDGVPHGALWHDLACLAAFIEKPKPSRRALASTILSKAYPDTEAHERDNVSWLFTKRNDLLDVAILAITDAAWFDFFAANKLWTPDSASWVVSAWLARDFADATRFETALVWRKKLNREFDENLTRRLQQNAELPTFWLHSWRLLLKSDPGREPDYVSRYDLIRALQGPAALHDDLLEAVRFLSPGLTLTDRRFAFYGDAKESAPTRFADLTTPRLAVRDSHGAAELIEILKDTSDEAFVIAAATFELRLAIGLSIDAGLLDGDFDMNDAGLPSIEEHPQNAHHDGINFIVRLLADLIPRVAVHDVSAARGYAIEWRALPGRVGTRLWLHAMRHESIFDATEAMQGVMSLSENDFWATRREVVLVLRDRARAADPAVVHEIEARILDEAARHFDRYQIGEGQVDWRGHARDQAVWLRLTMLAQAGVLSKDGKDELDAIRQRRGYLDRSTEERDFFATYMTGIRSVVGDPKPLLEAQDDDRLKLAREIVESPDPDTQQGWGAFCRSDPAGALDTLSTAPFTQANAQLWSALVYALSMGSKEEQASRGELVVRAFSALQAADDSFLGEIVQSLSTLFWSTTRRNDAAVSNWWSRLFGIAAQNEKLAAPNRNLDFAAINSPSGRLIHATMDDASAFRRAGEEIPPRLIEQFTAAANATGQGGVYCRVLMAREAAFVLSIEGEAIRESLGRALAADDEEGAALRAALVNSGSFSPLVARSFRDQILRGVIEMRGDNQGATNAAAKILAPAVNVLLGHQTLEDSGITAADAARALREGPPSLRRGAADCFSRWVSEIEGQPSENWRRAIEPTFLRIWPKELRFREDGLSRHFAALAARSGDEFPEALKRLRPYMSPLTGHSGLHEIEDSQAPDRWPHETLTMLWLLCGPASEGTFYEMPKLIERIMAADPALEVDRRLQWLQQHRFMYG